MSEKKPDNYRTAANIRNGNIDPDPYGTNLHEIPPDLARVLVERGTIPAVNDSGSRSYQEDLLNDQWEKSH